jgi:hypothetical protein
LDSNSNLTKSMTHHKQTKELTTWFLNLPIDESINNKRHKVWSLNPRPDEAQLEDQKPTKSLRRSSRRRKTAKANKRHEKWQSHAKWQRRAKKSSKQKNSKPPLKSTPPNTLNASSLPYIDIIMFLFSTTRLAKSWANFVPILSPFGNELIKQKSGEERDAMHEIQN